MEKVEVRGSHKVFCKKGKSPREIHDDIIKPLSDESPSEGTVNKWAAEGERGEL